MTLRILQAMAGSRHGGAEAFFERLVIALKESGIDQQIVIRADNGRAARLRAAGLSPRELRFGGPFDLATRLALRNDLRRYQPDVVMSWMSRATTMMPSRWFAGDRAVRIGRLGGYYDLKYYRGCDHLIGNTRDIVEYITRGGWPMDRAHYLPNFVDATPAAPVDRATLGVPSNALLVLALGRLHRNKAFDVLIAAVAKSPSVYLWLAGAGELQHELEAQAGGLGLGQRIRFLGWREDVGTLMAAADVIACPSRHEPLGNVVIEAWARRRAVIGAASSGPAGLIEPERNGLLVPVDDVEALADALTRLAADAGLRERLASGGYASYTAGFTREQVIRQYMDFFRKVTG